MLIFRNLFLLRIILQFYSEKTHLVLAGESSVRQVIRREVGGSQLRGCHWSYHRHRHQHRGHRGGADGGGGDVGGDVEVPARGQGCHQSR